MTVLRRAHLAQASAPLCRKPQAQRAASPRFGGAEDAALRVDARVGARRRPQPVEPARLNDKVGQEQIQFTQPVADQPRGHGVAPARRGIGTAAQRQAVGEEGGGAFDAGDLIGQSRIRIARRDQLSSPIRSAAMKASCGICTLPYSRIRFLPSFCFSRSFFLRVMSPP